LNDEFHRAVLVEVIAQLDVDNKNNDELVQIIVPAMVNSYENNGSCKKELTGKPAKVAKERFDRSIHKRDNTLSEDDSVSSEMSEGTSLIKSSVEHEKTSSCRGLVPLENSEFTISRSFDLR
jgi:hypothetical protein